MWRWLVWVVAVPAACEASRGSVSHDTDGIVLADSEDFDEPSPPDDTRLDLGAPEVTLADPPPPPTSGGTLVASRDGAWMFAADPDRDALYVVEVSSATLTHRVAFAAGSEPGRVAEGDDGRVYVALRRSGEVATIDPLAGELVEVRSACANPRGIAVGPDDGVLVACADGVLVQLGAYGSSARLEVGVELRDIVDVGPPVRVSTFRDPAVLTLDADGAIVGTVAPREIGVRHGRYAELPAPGAVLDGADALDDTMTPNTARRTLATTNGFVPGGGPKRGPGWVMLHQAASLNPLRPEPGGYGSGSCIPIQATVISHAATDDAHARSWPLEHIAPAFDLAVTPDATMAAVVGGVVAGWALVIVNDEFTPRTVAFECSGPGTVRLFGEPIAVVFDADRRAWVQQREPAALVVVDPSTLEVVDEVVLNGVSVFDTGHDLFHRPTTGMVACVSCHPEGREDGRIWTFEGRVGPRRSQSLDVDLGGSEPLHWRGEFEDFASLAAEVRDARMAGGELWPEQSAALERWVYSLAPLHPIALDADAVARGRALFEALGCDGCHVGDRLTNDLTVPLGKRGWLQVPSLLGVAYRGPWMHDGRSPTLEAAIVDMLEYSSPGPPKGGVEARALADLVAYLRAV